MTASNHDVAVVGLGGLGSAAAYELAARGLRVVGLEQFELGHVRGASHDHSRIIRRSYHTPAYVELTAAAYAAWAQVEAESGRRLVTPTGGVDLYPPGAAIDVTSYTSSMAAVGVPFELLDGAEVRSRWPAFAVGDDVLAVYQDATGIVPADTATATLQQLAVRHGAELRPQTPVLELRPVGDGVDVVTPTGTLSVGQVVVAADVWTNRLLGPLGHAVPLTVLREQLSYFGVGAADLDGFAIGRFPVWIWMDDPSFYGFPTYGRPGTIKAAEDCGGSPVDPDRRSFEPSPAAERRLRGFLGGLLAPPLGRAASATCLYTLTPDRDFVVDRLPDHLNVVVLLGAAHAFKFAAWFGRTAAELVVGGGASTDIGAFRLDRSGLRAPAERAAWLA